MDFKLVFSKLLVAFTDQDVRYALIGGFALGAWGVPRGTVDIDFLVHYGDMEKVDTIMGELSLDDLFRELRRKYGNAR